MYMCEHSIRTGVIEACECVFELGYIVKERRVMRFDSVPTTISSSGQTAFFDRCSTSIASCALVRSNFHVRY